MAAVHGLRHRDTPACRPRRGASVGVRAVTPHDLERLAGRFAIVVGLIAFCSMAILPLEAWLDGRDVYPYELEMK